MSFALEKIEDYFNGKNVQSEKPTDGRCTYSSLDVVNFGCKYGGK